MTPFPIDTPEPGQTFRHTDGGLYRFEGGARDSRDTAPLYIYKHLWPFDPLVWARPAIEWAGRFTAIPPSAVQEAMRGDRVAAQVQVIQAKEARRALQG